MAEQELRIANSSVLAAMPYSFVQGQKGIHYRESLPRENMELLLRNEVDVALVSISDFARHGLWKALDFGVAYEANSKALLLISGSAFSSLSRIYYTPKTEHVVSHLRVILHKRDITGVEFARIIEVEDVRELADDEGLFTMRDDAHNFLSAGYVSTDVAELWQGEFGGPLVSLLWVLRPELTNIEILKQCNSLFHRAVAAQAGVVAERAARAGGGSEWLVDYMRSSFQYYVDANVSASIDEFFTRAERLRILPHARYKNPTAPLISQAVNPQSSDARGGSVAESLMRVVDGTRLSLAEATEIAENCSIIDLGMVSDYLRKQYSRKRTIKYSFNIQVSLLEDLESLKATLRKSIDRGLSIFHFEGVPESDYSLDFFSSALKELKADIPRARFEGFDSRDIEKLAYRSGLELEEVVRRLVRSGLDVVSMRGGPKLTGQDWGIQGLVTRIARALVLHGGELQCDLNFTAGESWDDWFAYLYRLRALQDETSVVSSCYVTYTARNDSSEEDLTTDAALRLVALTRLFLDNVDNIVEQGIDQDPLLRLMGLCFGSNKVSIDMDGENPIKVIRMLKDLWGLGMAIETTHFEPSEKQYH